VRIICSDEPFTENISGIWKDPTGRNINPGSQIRTKQRLYNNSKLGLAIVRAYDHKKGILLCNNLQPGEMRGAIEYNGDDIKKQDYLFSRLNSAATSQEMTVDRLSKFISAELIHEMIYLGDSTQCKWFLGDWNN
jgi:hypothetical protein